MNELKTNVNNLDVDKLKINPVDVKKLSDIVDNDVVKKTNFNALNKKYIT